jgi:hypothetical protein
VGRIFPTHPPGFGLTAGELQPHSPTPNPEFDFDAEAHRPLLPDVPAEVPWTREGIRRFRV